MKENHTLHKIPSSRIATMDVYAVGKQRHHVSALLELDVTGGRQKLRELKRDGMKVSFTGWIIRAIATTVREHPEVAAYLRNRRHMITFQGIHVSTMVERETGGKRVPLAMVIENADEKSVPEITAEIGQARNRTLSPGEMVINRRAGIVEALYARLPGFLRRAVWHWMEHHPKTAYRQMGNVMVTSLSMLGKTGGWFIFSTVHPVAFGLGAVKKKPWVVGDSIEPREILHMTVLIDHDVVDGAPMARFTNDLVRRIETGADL